MNNYNILKRTLLVFMVMFFYQLTFAQNNLNKRITITIENQNLSDALTLISKKGGFYFSYSSNIIPNDSLITFRATNKTVKEILDQLLKGHYEYKESKNYIIINKKLLKGLSMIDYDIKASGNQYTISGYVVDAQSGEKIYNASVFERQLLSSTLTNKDGYFSLRLKNVQKKTIDLTASKSLYRDTTVMILHEITVRPGGYRESDNMMYDEDSSQVERTFMGRIFLSSKQSIQSLNLAGFFADRPFQASVVPGLSSHGMMSSQVVNKFSFNIIGGYTAGVDGFEMAGIFNINKKNSQYVQLAGVFNVVGGSVKGVQLSGITNTILDSVDGVQLTGIYNFVNHSMKGVQLAGIFNNGRSVGGVQLSGIANHVGTNARGFQLAGITNIVEKDADGVQLAGILNYSKKFSGFQLAVINVADSSSGCSLGLLNFIKNGYFKVGMTTNELTNANVYLKTGNSKLYTMLMAGTNLSDQEKVFTFGLGLGHDFIFGNRVSVSVEASSQSVFTGDWSNTGILAKGNLNINVKLVKGIAITAGPTFSMYTNGNPVPVEGYRTQIPPSNYHTYVINSSTVGWIGWNAGLIIF